MFNTLNLTYVPFAYVTFEYSSQNVCNALNKIDRFDGERPLHTMTCYLRH